MSLLLRKLYAVAKQPPTPLRIDYLCKLSQTPLSEKLIFQTKFLQKELPIRLAGRVVDLDNLPYGLAYQPSVKYIRELYMSSFDKIHSFPNAHNNKLVHDFTNLLIQIKKEHDDVPLKINNGISTFKSLFGDDIYHSEYRDSIDKFLDRFFSSRIGIRTMIDFHVNTVKENKDIIQHTKIYDIFTSACINLESIAMDTNNLMPKMIFVGDENISINYIPSHIHYIMLEVLKNSVQACIKNNVTCPIICKVIETNTDIVIKIIDEAKSFNRSKLPYMFSYFHTSEEKISSLSGYGYGLPLSRLYARYFGGDFYLVPFEGYGTEAIIYINKIGNIDEIIH